MTTFTLQDLTPNTIETPEEKEAMDMLEVKNAVSDFVISNQVENTSTKPSVEQLAQQLTQTFSLLITELSRLAEDKQPVSSSVGGDADLRGAVDVVLEQAEWFSDKLNDTINSTIDDRIEEHDFSYEVEQATENWFGNFSLEDHVDVYSMVETAVDNKLDDVVEEKLESVVETKLEELLQGKNISISFN